jgi:hypothetical protein
MKNPVCSIKHFEKLLKQFFKMANKQIVANIVYEETTYQPKSGTYLSLTEYLSSNFIFNTEILKAALFESLLPRFKADRFKTKSEFTIKFDEARFFVSYTVEDSNHNRMYMSDENYDMIDKFIIFRVYCQYSQKRLLAKWSVPITW